MDDKDVVLLLLGAALSFPIAVLASWVAGPLITIMWSYRLASVFSALLGWTAPMLFREGNWELTWLVESDRFPRVNKSAVTLRSFLNVVAGEWIAVTNDNQKIVYRMLAVRTSATMLTGRWFDKIGDDLGYVGALQLAISHTRTSAEGKWIGFARDGSVKANVITMRKIEQPRA